MAQLFLDKTKSNTWAQVMEALVKGHDLLQPCMGIDQ